MDDKVESGLSSDDPEIRRQAVLRIAEAVDTDQGELLLRALGDDDWRVREEAIQAGKRVAVRYSMIDGLIDSVCQGNNVGLRNAALDLLGQLGSSAVSPLVAALPQTGEGSRKFVIEALARSGDPGVVATLVQASQSDDSNLVASAIEALAAIGGPEAEAALRGKLDAEDTFERMAAVDALNRLDAFIPFDEIKPLLSDRLVFRVALKALGRCGHKQALGPALQALSDRSERVAATAVLTLSQLCDSSDLWGHLQARLPELGVAALERLRDLARRGDGSVKAAATQLLCMARDGGAYEPVVELAFNSALPRGTVDAIRAWGMPAARGIFDVYEKGSTLYRATALELAGDLARELEERHSSEPDFVAELRAALRRGLQSEDSTVLIAALRSMSVWGEREDVVGLLAHAAAEDELVRRASQASLRAVAEREPEAVSAALSGVNLEGRGGAELTRLVAVLGGPAAMPRLQTALLADDPDTRCAAIAGLAERGGAKSGELIALSLTDESAVVQAAAARALGNLRGDQGEPVGVEPLLLTLERAQPEVQAAIASALGVAGDRRAIARLRQLLPNAPALVRIAAIEALRALRAEDLADTLLDTLGADDPEVVKQALTAIAEEGGDRAAERVAIALEHRAWDVRRVAADLLAGTTDTRARALLEARLATEQDALVRDALERALSQQGEGEL